MVDDQHLVAHHHAAPLRRVTATERVNLLFEHLPDRSV